MFHNCDVVFTATDIIYIFGFFFKDSFTTALRFPHGILQVRVNYASSKRIIFSKNKDFLSSAEILTFRDSRINKRQKLTVFYNLSKPSVIFEKENKANL